MRTEKKVLKKALFRGVLLAESDDTFNEDGTYFFPPETVHKEFLQPGNQTGLCLWCGVPEYFDIVAGGHVLRNGAWTFHNPSRITARIKDFIAFGADVQVREV